MTETLANGYSFESTQRELSNEYQHDRVTMIFKNLCILVIWIKVALALEGLIYCRSLKDLNLLNVASSAATFGEIQVAKSQFIKNLNNTKLFRIQNRYLVLHPKLVLIPTI